MKTQPRPVRLIPDTSSIDEVLRALDERAAPEPPVEFVERISELVHMKCEVLTTAGAPAIRVSLQPSERLLKLVTAFHRARQVDGVVVEEARHEHSPPVSGTTPRSL